MRNRWLLDAPRTLEVLSAEMWPLGVVALTRAGTGLALAVRARPGDARSTVAVYGVREGRATWRRVYPDAESIVRAGWRVI